MMNSVDLAMEMNCHFTRTYIRLNMLRLLLDYQGMLPIIDDCTSSVVNLVVKLRRVELSMKFHLRATGCHLPYVITQCYLPPDSSELAPPVPSQRPVLDLPTDVYLKMRSHLFTVIYVTI